MADEVNSTDDVTVLAADRSLLRKLGGASLGVILSPEVIKRAEGAITDAADGLYSDCVDEGVRLRVLVDSLKQGGDAAFPLLKNVVTAAFSTKTKAGLAGLDLVAALAKSLQILCEKMTASELTPATLQVIEWHVQSIGQLLSLRVKGDGGQVGKAILAEIDKLSG
jgi:hypothetical protein